MVVVSYSGKEINAKLVYYGAGLCGKTTNLEAIYEAVPDTSRGKMVSMKTQSDRTLFFDLLPLDLGEIMGFKTRFLLYTVPGQVFYNATRKLVLKGADAIVFVADSEVGKMEENRESLANLRTNLAEYNINLDTIPWVLQYNKRDLPNIYTIEELNAELNVAGKIPWFESVARDGKGVFETFRGISHLLMEKVTKDLRRGPATSTPRTPAAPEAAAAVSPRDQARLSASPPTPAQAIQHEAHSTPASILGGDESRIDYGREVELPGGLPVASHAPEPHVTPVTTPVTVGAAMPAPVPTTVTQAFASHALFAQAPAPAAQPSATPPAPAPVAHAAPAAPAARAATYSPPPGAPQPMVRVETQATAPASTDGKPIPLVVPVTLTKGGTYEIVIRLHIEAND